MSTDTIKTFTATRNACKVCAPLGACLAFQGVEGAISLLHGSQGCSTYIRRYMISHFKEPVDIASSSFSESTAIFGGKENLRLALKNVMQQYRPGFVGIATTCLAETIGEDVAGFVREFRKEHWDPPLPALAMVSTPSYAGTHAEGYYATVRAIVDSLAEGGPPQDTVNILPGIISPADFRYLKEVCADFGLRPIFVPDYSDTLDGPAWQEYHRIPPGGTPVDDIRATGRSMATIEFNTTADRQLSGGALLESRFRVPRHVLGMPIGVCATDRFFETLEAITGRRTPDKHKDERGRLIDCFVDAHKYVFDKRAVVYGEQDLVVGLAGMLAEVGMVPVMCASGAATGRLRDAILEDNPDLASRVTALEAVDFAGIEERAAGMRPDLIVGSSKGYPLARRLGIPLVRVGFPIHDRIGGARVVHLGYRGAQQLFDRVANALIESQQDASKVGYAYM
jgi:nitrogenase molybdenum-iron protein NifN